MTDGAARASGDLRTGGWGDALRLSVGTLSVLPTAPPRTVDPTVAGRSLALAPVTALLLGAGAAAAGAAADTLGLSALVTAAVAVAVLALLSRAVHLDGLADTCDAFGVRGDATRALAVMRRSDVGAFGALALVLVVLLQVSALAQLWAAGHGPASLVTAVVVSRGVLPWLCRRGVRAARPDGLGAVVAGTVGPGLLLPAAAVTVLVAAGVGAADGGAGGAFRALLAVVLGTGAALGLAARCRRRLGGVTGDVLGAGVELALTVALLTLAPTP